MKQSQTSARSRRMKRWVAVVAAAVASSVVATTASQASGNPSSAKKPKRGGAITYGIDANIGGWCFPQALSAGPLGATRLVYEQLVERNAKGEFVPYLAESWQNNANGKEWIFKLRPNIKFSNGEEFNADVVKFNMDIGRGLTTAKYWSSTPSYGSTGIGVNSNINSVDVVDNLTVKITLDRADNDFLGLMYRAGRYVMRAPEQAKNAATCSTNGIGTGPFKIQSYRPDELVTVRNDLYWQKDANGVQLPYLDKVTVVVIKEASQRAAAVRRGTIDVGFFGLGDATFIKDMQKRKSVLTELKGKTNLWGQWMPNQSKAGSPFKYLNCRKAIAHAIDWKTYNTVRLKGLGSYNGSIVGKDHIMYSLEGSLPFNKTLAQDFVGRCNTDLGAAGPFKVTLYADTSTQSLNNTKAIENMLKAVGITVNPTYQAEANILITNIYRPAGNSLDFAQGTPAEGPGAGYVMPFFIDKAFPDDSTNPLRTSALAQAYQKVIAIGNHTDAQVGKLLYAAMGEPDPKKAKPLWAAGTKYLQENAIAIPAIHGYTFTFVNRASKLNGWGKYNNPDGTRVSVVEIRGQDFVQIWKG
ncbi:MAG: ABC transporter substrate-binding protein [Actinobacteria bacterium]|nr:ABC transporter substrate-binding protein [Actinomycetota bacterium]